MSAPASLAEALVAFQKNAPAIRKDAVNPHFKNRYASLDAIMDAVRGPLADQGLALSQHPTVHDGTFPALRTVLLHTSGERLEDVMLLAVDKPGPQAQGSALTYARRYAALGVLGLVADEDDDGQSAEPKTATAQGPQRTAHGTEKSQAADTGGGSTTETADLTARLLAAADKLGALEATKEALWRNVAKGDPAAHLAWLRRQLKTAEANVELRKSESSPFVAPQPRGES